MNVADPSLVAQVAERLEAVRSRIVAAGGTNVAILPVTKTWGVEWCFAAHGAGCGAVGENYAQEVAAKLAMPDRPFSVRFIGQLQTNKVRMLAPLVQVFETVDRISLVRELAARVPGAQVLIQVVPIDQPASDRKGGCVIDEVPKLVDDARSLGLEVRGLMAVGPTDGGPEAARPTFRAVRSLADRLGLYECSMGMSGDLEVAVQEGSTQVRVGSALFGERPPFTTTVR